MDMRASCRPRHCKREIWIAKVPHKETMIEMARATLGRRHEDEQSMAKMGLMEYCMLNPQLNQPAFAALMEVRM
jgi:hypothetical protein